MIVLVLAELPFMIITRARNQAVMEVRRPSGTSV